MNRATRNRLSFDMRTIRIIGALAAAFIVAGCVPRPAPPAPAPAPPPRPAPEPAPPPPEPSPPPANWEDAPLSPGDWSYRDQAGMSSADYVVRSGGLVALSCYGNRQIVISIASGGGVPPRSIVVRTTYGERRLPAAPDRGQVRAALAADDPLLDQIAFSRGRVLLQAEGGQPLIVPSWPEPARVIEDCRA